MPNYTKQLFPSLYIDLNYTSGIHNTLVHVLNLDFHTSFTG